MELEHDAEDAMYRGMVIGDDVFDAICVLKLKIACALVGCRFGVFCGCFSSSVKRVKSERI